MCHDLRRWAKIQDLNTLSAGNVYQHHNNRAFSCRKVSYAFASGPITRSHDWYKNSNTREREKHIKRRGERKGDERKRRWEEMWGGERRWEKNEEERGNERGKERGKISVYTIHWTRVVLAIVRHDMCAVQCPLDIGPKWFFLVRKLRCCVIDPTNHRIQVVLFGESSCVFVWMAPLTIGPKWFFLMREFMCCVN